ncbi:MAG: homoserine dehydrogenase [Gammaproteobacteria bacterium]
MAARSDESSHEAPLRVGLAGLGTVGQGTLSVLARNRSPIRARAGRDIEVVRVASRTPKPEVDLLGGSFSTDLASLIEDESLDVIVELIGGEGPALELVRDALRRGKAVVTANKAILAAHGDELTALAREHGGRLAFEAAVGGGIPIISAMNRSLAANNIRWLAGIINGTSNYILTAMTESRRSFEAALAEAQALGYAEADPTFDVEGIDAAHKLTILAALAFQIGYRFQDVYTEGIAQVTVEDIEYARQLGYQVKHLGIARADDNGVQMRVHPTLIPERELLASVNGVMNAVLVNGNAAGDTLYYGAGAGGLPTASAVVADLIDLARGNGPDLPTVLDDNAIRIAGIEDVVTGYYLKIPSLDKPGVFAKVATILSERDISIEAAIQKEQAIHTETEQAWVPIIILTQPVPERVMNDAIEAVRRLPEVVGPIGRIRVEHLDDD